MPTCVLAYLELQLPDGHCLWSRFRPEAEHSANAGLHVARELLEPIKKKYPWISYSDLWTLAGCVAVEELGGDPHTPPDPTAKRCMYIVSTPACMQ